MNDYYVYEWIRLDTNEPFYVGKGRRNRWKSFKGRNKWFDRIVNKTLVVVNVLQDNLDEETANGLEVWYIREYRDIIGYPMCNIADGGEGCALVGENNGMYGKNPRDYMTEETKIEHDRKQRESMKEKNKGKNPRDNMTEEAKKERDRKASESMKGKNKNPRSKETREKISKTRIEKGIAKDKKHPNATSIICLTTKRIFLTVKEAQKFYNIKGISDIGYCCRGFKIVKGKKVKVKSAGKLPDGTKLVWKYLIWKHNKKYRIKEVK